MKGIKQYVKSLWINNQKVAENYFFIAFLQVATVLINVFLYPYLIRTLGKESYGTYIFILSNVQLFVLFFASGFSVPALKKIALNTDNLKIKSQTISEIFTAKFILFGLCAVVLVFCIYFIPFVRENHLLYIIMLSTMALGDMLFPLWYFQGMQRMSFVAYINLGCRLLSIPLIISFVKSSSDLLFFVIIMSVLPFIGSAITLFYLRLKENISLKFVSLKKLLPVFRDATPFYWTSAFSQLKNEGIKFFIGVFWGMNNVAIYDLANKIISIASIFTGSINTAVFPKVIINLSTDKIKRIFRYETIIGFSMSVLVIVLGYWAILVLGGEDMLEAYPLTIIMSFTIYLSLMVSCYVNYIFVPRNHYYFITRNQFVSTISFIILAFVGLMLYRHIAVLVLAYTLSQVIEIFYCKCLIKKHKLL